MAKNSYSGFWPCGISYKLLSGISMVSKAQWIRSSLIGLILINVFIMFFASNLESNRFIWVNIFAFWALLHLWILAKIVGSWIQHESTSGGVFWVIMKLGSLAALAQVLSLARKSTTPLVILTGLTAFIVVPIVASLNASRT